MRPSAMVLAISSFIDEYRIGSERELVLLFLGHRLFSNKHDALRITGPFVIGDFSTVLRQGPSLATIQGHDEYLWFFLDLSQHG